MKNNKFLAIISLIAFFMYSCQDEPLEEIQNTTTNIEVEDIEVDPYESGTQLNNPYTVRNMEIALDSLKSKIASGYYKYTPFSSSNLPVRRKSEDDFLENFTIEGSHRYMRFTPQNETEAASLKQDSTLVLFDYPLDYDFPDSFFENRADNATGDEIVEYYTTVRLDRSLPNNVSSQNLAEIYVPEDDPLFNQLDVDPLTREQSINNLEAFLHHLLLEAYSNTGNIEVIRDGIIEDPNSNQRILIFGRRWRPSGRIRVWDDSVPTVTTSENCHEEVIGYDNTPCLNGDTLNCPLVIYETVCTTSTTSTGGSFVPLEGVQILMRQFFTVAQGITDADGNFTTGRIRGRAKYVIQWERYQYSIRRGLTFQAELKGPRRKDAPWYKDIIGPGGRDHYHAMIHAGALNYYYGDRLGTQTPPRNGEGQGQIKIGAMGNDANSSHIPFGSDITVGLLPDIYLQEENSPAFEIFGEITHELAHAAHRELDRNTYDNVVWDAYTNVFFSPPLFNLDSPMGPTANNNRRLMETWATLLETAITFKRYRVKYGVTNFNYLNQNFQDQTIIDDIHYTSAGIDMIEGTNGFPILNQSVTFGNLNPVDRVNNFTILQLENALIDSSSWWEWRDRIHSQNPGNGSRVFLNELFNNW